MTKWTDKDTAKETGASPKEVKEASHDARNKAAEEGGWNVPKDRHAAREQKENEKSYNWGDAGK